MRRIRYALVVVLVLWVIFWAVPGILFRDGSMLTAAIGGLLVILGIWPERSQA